MRPIRSPEDSFRASLAAIMDIPLAMVPAGGVDTWLATRGLKLVRSVPGSADLHGIYSIGFGLSPRAPHLHAVVCKSGRTVFDTHPSDDGCGPIIYHQRLIELSEGEQLRHAQSVWNGRRAA